MSNEKRGAGKIDNKEFLKAYNDKKLSNQGVMDQLNCEWSAVNVKLRSAAVEAETTLMRSGGAKGTVTVKATGETLTFTDKSAAKPAKATAAKAEKPAKASAAKPAKAKAEKPAAKAKAAKGSATASASSSESTSSAGAESVYFNVNIFGNNETFKGPTIEKVREKFVARVAALNFSKVALANDSGRAISLNDMVHGGQYRASKQLTAA